MTLKQYVAAITAFDRIISDNVYEDNKIHSSCNYGKNIKDLFHYILDSKASNCKMELHPYIYQTFKCFIDHKQKIVINLSHFEMFVSDEIFRELLFGENLVENKIQHWSSLGRAPGNRWYRSDHELSSWSEVNMERWVDGSIANNNDELHSQISLQLWLESEVEMPNLLSQLLGAGYDSLASLQNENMDTLKDIGDRRFRNAVKRLNRNIYQNLLSKSLFKIFHNVKEVHIYWADDYPYRIHR